ncbi:MAG: agmatine deiminase family protein, partial [Thermoleophilia bacterium]|nr:agmatine deiminase family protein [Thermoleophilia bacterium]
ELVRLLVRAEPVRMLVREEGEQQAATEMLEQAGVDTTRVRFYLCPTDRNWLRDTGPTFIKNSAGELGAVVWRFDGWGRFPAHKRDRRVARWVAEAAHASYWELDFVLEGGAVDVNGEGLLLATEECLLRRVGCGEISRERWEKVFRDCLGVRRVVWLPWGLGEDETGGHVDQVARFVAPDTVVLAVTRDRAYPDFERVQENLRVLKSLRDALGVRLRVLEAPLPEPVYFRGERLPASYLNFYVANGLVIVPVFNDPADREALNLLSECFPGREVVGLYSRDLVVGEGGPHCLTQQQPAASRGTGRAWNQGP